MSAPLAVLYLAGVGRSGSTLLERVLARVEGFASMGELYYLWEAGFVENRRCACGEPFAECPLWTAVVERAYGGREGVNAREMLRVARDLTPVRAIPRLLFARAEGPRQRVYLSSLERLYEAIGAVTGARVVVDSSKLPGYGHALSRVSGIRLHALHLVRDPRAVAHSWSRLKWRAGEPESGVLPRKPAWKSVLQWCAWNAAVETRWNAARERYLRLRYEDLAADPRRSVERILEWMGEPRAGAEFLRGGPVEPARSHSLAGNPDRLREGPIVIRDDREWVTRMPAADRALVTAIALPLMRRYGFPLARPRSPK